MSRTGCPYDNSVMERYFNTLKHECTNHYSFTTKERIDSTIFDFEESWYNSQRSHTLNNGKHLIRSMQTLPYCTNFSWLEHLCVCTLHRIDELGAGYIEIQYPSLQWFLQRVVLQFQRSNHQYFQLVVHSQIFHWVQTEGWWYFSNYQKLQK